MTSILKEAIMDLHSGEALRSRIDALRAAARSSEPLRRDLETDPQAALERHGLLARRGDTLRNALTSRHDGTSAHRCPWHTCQGTRHIHSD
jgi:hypothetical protein